jgi:phosphocarrier protein
MLEEEITVTNPKGIHARPSALIVKTAQQLDSSVRFTLHGETVDATNIMDVLSLGAAPGETILVSVDGGNEADAMARMREIFALNFNDD